MLEIRFGIDFGNSSTKISYSFVDKEDVIKTYILPIYNSKNGIPSIGYYNEQTDEWLFGNEAFLNANDSKKPIIRIKELLENCINDSYYQKKFINKDCDYDFVSKTLNQREVVEEFFKYIIKGIKEYKDFKHDKISNKLGLTYHTSASNDYKIELKNIVEGLGFEVVRMVPEAVSAALSVIDDLIRFDYKRILVMDIGADTTDIAIINHNSGRLSTRYVENIRCAGNDIDSAIYNYFIEKGKSVTNGENLTHFQRYSLLEQCKEAKHYVSLDDVALIEYEGFVKVYLPFDYDDYKRVTSRVVNQISDFFSKIINEHSVDLILLCGGGAESKLLFDEISNENNLALRKTKLIVNENPVFTTAVGASINALEVYELLSVSAKTYGVIATDLKNNTDVLSCIIPKNTPLPYQTSKKFYTSKVGQRNISIVVGESDVINEKIPLTKATVVASAHMNIGRPSSSRVEPVTITFKIDKNGVIDISAISNYGDKAKIVIKNGKID